MPGLLQPASAIPVVDPGSVADLCERQVQEVKVWLGGPRMSKRRPRCLKIAGEAVGHEHVVFKHQRAGDVAVGNQLPHLGVGECHGDFLFGHLDRTSARLVIDPKQRVRVNGELVSQCESRDQHGGVRRRLHIA